MALVLIVDDDRDTRFVIRNLLLSRNYDVIEARSGTQAFETLESNDIDIAVIDLVLGDMSGIDVLKKIKSEAPEISVIMFTGHADVSTAVESIKLGAFDYLVKPFSNDDFLLAIEKALKERRISREFEAIKKHVYSHNLREFMPSRSLRMKKVEEMAGQVAGSDLSVLISGPSGSGKEVMAKFIHSLSGRRKNQFVALDCGALPENLVESELFGYEKGAFTGADKRKDGLFEIAFGGTLFLDEISNLSFSTQAKLLRVIQERKIRHLGGKKDIMIDVRIITASNRPLEQMIKEGGFREDLYHRINQFSLQMPSLAERKEDIKYLSMFFLDQANKMLNKKVKSVSDEALKALEARSWPGNIRELKNAIIRGVLLSDKTVLSENLGLGPSLAAPVSSVQQFHPDGADFDFNLKKAVSAGAVQIERDLIEKALKHTGGNKIKAARILGIDRKSLYSKIKKCQVETRSMDA